MLNLIRYCKGYLYIGISGYAPERFMNLCRNHQIILWDISYSREQYFCKVSIDDFRKMKPFAKKTKVRAVIIKKFGLPFLMHKNKKRKIFMAGIPTCLLFLFMMTGFIWTFEFKGNIQITDDMLYNFCEEENVRIGSRINSVDIEQLEKKIREKFTCITWVSVKFEGTKLIIEMNENDLEEIKKIPGNGVGMNMVAQTKGKIIKMITRAGVPCVKIGDEVEKGTILVEGSIPIFDNDGNIISYEYCQADADILLECSYPVSKELSRYYCYKNYTGRSKIQRYIRIGNQLFTGFAKKIKYPCYDSVKEEKQLCIYENIYLPVFWGRITYREYVEIDALYSLDAAEELLKEYLEELKKELSEKGVQIIQNNVKIEKNKNRAALKGYFVVTLWNEQKEALIPKQTEPAEEQELTDG